VYPPKVQALGILSQIWKDRGQDGYSKARFSVYYDPITEGRVSTFIQTNERSPISVAPSGPSVIFIGGGVERLMLTFDSSKDRSMFLETYYNPIYSVQYLSLHNTYQTNFYRSAK
jgi:hypothetical protein